MSKSLEIGIVGLPNVGKSTLFNALTKNNALAANYPFATIEPNVGIVTVPDERLNRLAKLFNSEKIIQATIKFIDIAGLVKGANTGEGLGNKFLSHIRECNAICQVVRDFSDHNVTHVNNKIDPRNDIEIVNTELVLADLQTVDKRIYSTEKLAKSDPKIQLILLAYKNAKECLEKNIPLIQASEIDLELLKDLNLLTSKPIIYAFNVSETVLKDEAKKQELQKLTKGAPAIFINAKLEQELNSLEPAEAKELLNAYGQSESALQQLITASYKILGLQSYLTAGPKETRAWTILQGSTAPEAAGVIHTDFQKGFIAADIVSYKDLMESGSIINAKAKGKMRTEGKTYIMQPDDVVDFKFNV